ncbi:MAG: C45 family peptidase [Bifidobacteriaceae bacterium]|nr:C45 family peptidase [Bifidobacteriaceae bacterium]
MAVILASGEIAGLPWLGGRGPAREVFQALGARRREVIRASLEAMPEAAGLRRWLGSSANAARWARLRAATAAADPEGCRDLEALAWGAGVPSDLAYLANFRGDLGVDDAVGCSDVMWQGGQPVIGHNEDGAPAARAGFAWLSLQIDGRLPIAAQWYPSLLPVNAVTVNPFLVFSINHLPVRRAGPGAGRHFVARRLQQAESLDEFIALAGRLPAAGGFAFNVGEFASGRLASVESAAGQVAVRRLAPGEYLWHANHQRWLPSDDGAAGGPAMPDRMEQLGPLAESLARGARLDAVAVGGDPAGALGAVLTRPPGAGGAFRTAAGADPLMTLCTTLTALDSRSILVRAPDGAEQRLGLDQVLAGPGQP